MPSAAQNLENISQKDLEERVTTKFKDLTKAWKEEARKGTAVVVVVEGGVVVNAPGAVLAVSKAKLQSRARGVCFLL